MVGRSRHSWLPTRRSHTATDTAKNFALRHGLVWPLAPARVLNGTDTFQNSIANDRRSISRGLSTPLELLATTTTTSTTLVVELLATTLVERECV